jgi:hypothetical protein
MESQHNQDCTVVATTNWGQFKTDHSVGHGPLEMHPLLNIRIFDHKDLPCTQCKKPLSIGCVHCLHQEIDTLRDKVVALEALVNHLIYSPEGIGYREAKEEFDQHSDSLITNMH